MRKPQLFFLHFAGGSCYSYQFLFPYLERFEIIVLELPGRGKRITEPLIKRYEDAVEDYYLQITKEIRDADFLIYGHSMGATLGWEVVKKLEENKVFPALLVLSGNPGPGIIDRKGRYKLPKNEFIVELKRLGGISESFLENQELLEFFEPVLRADFEVLEKEEVIFSSAIKTPVVALMGSEEEKTDHIHNWQKYCSGPFFSKIMKGDHFFIYKYPRELAEIIQMYYDKFASRVKISAS